MNEPLIFDPVFPVWIVVLCATIFTMLFCWFEWQKTTRLRLPRIVAQIIMTAAIACMFLRPSQPASVEHSGIMLLTSNYSKAQTDSLRKTEAALIIVRQQDAEDFPGATVFSDNDIIKKLGDIRFVLGDGLPPYMATHDKAAFTFLPSPAPQGISSLMLPAEIIEGRPAMITGLVNVDAAGSLVRLRSPGGIDDSVVVDKPGSFRLMFTPRQQGRFLYSLQLKSGANTETQQLPIDVLPSHKLRMLILQHYPTTEVRYLKNFLAASGHHLTLRYELSRNIFRHEYANTEPLPVQRLDDKKLQDLDVVMIDSDVLEKMTSGERKQIQQAITKGLGLIVLFNDLPGKSKALRDFGKFTFQQHNDDTIKANVEGSGMMSLQTLGESIQKNDALQPLIVSTDQSVYSATMPSGLGNIGFQLITETYTFAVKGRNNHYAALWLPLLEKTARRHRSAYAIHTLTVSPIYPKETVAFEVISSGGVPRVFADSTVVPLTEDVTFDHRWLGKFWFDSPGWHALTVPEDSTIQYVYIDSAGARQSLRIQEMHRLNSLVSTGRPGEDVSTKNYQPVPVWIFFVVFLLSAGFLWVAPKI